jgi:flagellar protein FlbD
MIRVTRPDGTKIYLSPELIEIVESTPDTVIHFGHQHHLLVRESARQVVGRIIRYRRLLNRVCTQRPKRSKRC